MKKAIQILFIVAVLALAIYVIADERNRYAVSNSTGEVRSGTKFGVTIGTTINEARSILVANGFEEKLDPSDLDGLHHSDDRRFYFLDTGWRSGSVWLVESKGYVRAIGWRYQLGAP